MSSGRRLSEKEKGKIEALRAEGLTYREIAKKIKRSTTVVHNCIKLGKNYGLKRIRGHKSKVTPLTKKRIINLATKNFLSSAKIKSELQLEYSSRTVRRVLNSCPSLVYKKMKTKPPLTKLHKSARYSFADQAIRDRLDWSKIIWSDEKKFNLDGPDGLRYYWHDLRDEKQLLSKRAFGGGSLMVWGAFVNDTMLDLVVVDHKLDSKKYIEVLKKSLVPYMKPGLKFMQDGASAHRSKMTTNWLQNQKIDTIKWPAYSPDLNPIENIWGSLARAVFANGRQFKNKSELKEEVMRQWALISKNELNNLKRSMTDRVLSVIKTNGGSTKY